MLTARKDCGIAILKDPEEDIVTKESPVAKWRNNGFQLAQGKGYRPLRRWEREGVI